MVLYNKSIQNEINSMFNKDLTPMYDGRVLMNKTAMQDPVVKATLDAMAKRNFEPKRLNAYGVSRIVTNGDLERPFTLYRV